MKPAAEFWNGHTTTKRIPELLGTNYQRKGFQATKGIFILYNKLATACPQLGAAVKAVNHFFSVMKTVDSLFQLSTLTVIGSYRKLLTVDLVEALYAWVRGPFCNV